jgi:peptide chain release factor 2
MKLILIKRSLMMWGDLFDIVGLEKKINELEKKICDEVVWSDKNKFKIISKQKKDCEKKISDYKKIFSEWEDLYTLISLAIQENDFSLIQEINLMKNKFYSELDFFYISSLLNNEYDNNDAIVSLHAGAGGTESCDWVSMLYRMYSKWCDKHNFIISLIDILEGEDAGIKSITFEVKGDNAYGYLKSEKGVHRLIRISPFDSSSRRHTSFASCDVIPEINDETQEIKILPDEIRVDTYRSSGAGGQHVNKTDSAIRITHLPTGIVVQCQNERSQKQNRDFALKILKSKLLLLESKKQKEKIEGIRGVQKDIAWGNQIRTYVFHPYSMVKDHRTNTETGNIQAVMDGDIDLFINKFLSQINLVIN